MRIKIRYVLLCTTEYIFNFSGMSFIIITIIIPYDLLLSFLQKCGPELFTLGEIQNKITRLINVFFLFSSNLKVMEFFWPQWNSKVNPKAIETVFVLTECVKFSFLNMMIDTFRKEKYLNISYFSLHVN